jgi:Ion channel
MVLVDKLWRFRYKVRRPDDDNDNDNNHSDPNRASNSRKNKIFRNMKNKKRKLGKNLKKKGLALHAATHSATHSALQNNHNDYYDAQNQSYDTEETPLLMMDGEDEEQGLPNLTSNFHPSDSMSVLIQLACLYIVTYLMVAVIAYSYWLEPTWTIIDSLYFATNLFTTVGQGDKEPSTPMGQLFTVFMSVYGVLVLGVFLGILGHAVSEGQAEVIQRMKQKNRQTVLNTLINNAEQAEENTKKSPTKQPPPQPNHPPYTTTPTTCKPPTSNNSISSKNTNTTTNSSSNTFLHSNHNNNDNNNDNHHNDYVPWIGDMKSLLSDIWTVFKMEFPEIFLVVALAFVLGMREGWSVIQTLYFCIMSASTTGFGDFGAVTQLDKLYCVFFLPLSVAVLGEVLGRIATVYLQRKARQKEQAFLRKTITLCDIRRMDANQDDTVDMEEFLTFMLVALQKVDPQDLEDLKQTFYALDANGNGLLDKGDLVQLTHLAHNASREAGPDSPWSQLEMAHTKQH